MRWLRIAFNPSDEQFANVVTATLVGIIIGIVLLYALTV